MGSSYTGVSLPAFYDVSKLGAVGDGTTDCSVAIKAAVALAAQAGGGTVFFPPGIWRIACAVTQDPLIVDGLGRGQIILPCRALHTQAPITIRFQGPFSPAGDVNWTANNQPLYSHGAVIISDVAGSFGTDGIFAGGPLATADSEFPFNNIRVEFDNLVIRGPNLTPLALQNIGQAKVTNSQVDIGVIQNQITSQPSNGTFGVNMPKLSNWGLSHMSNVDLVGFPVGAQFSEHAFLSDVRAWCCVYAFQSNGGPHAVRLDHILAVACQGTIQFFDQPTRLSGPASIRREMSIFGGNRAWNNTTIDFNDPGNNCIGHIYFDGVKSEDPNPSAHIGSGANMVIFDTASFPIPVANGTTNPVTSITNANGIITAIS